MTNSPYRIGENPGVYVENCSPFFIVGADESMLETVLNGNVIVPEGITEAIAAQFDYLIK